MDRDDAFVFSQAELDGIIATRKTAVSYRRGSGSARGVENSSAKGVHAETAPGAESCFRMSSGRAGQFPRAPECEAGLVKMERPTT
jgi:hypothetical protein